MSLELLTLHWQVALVSSLMIIGAVIDGWKLKVPNWLTFSMILSGWAYWASVSGSQLQSSIVGTFAAGGLLLLPYMIGGMGAGDVKLYAGFGAWMVPLEWFGMQHLFNAFCVSVIVGGVMAAGMIVWKRSLSTNMSNAKEILMDLQTSTSIGEIADRAKVRKPSLTLLPYGVPLTIGSLAYLAYMLPSVVGGNLFL